MPSIAPENVDLFGAHRDAAPNTPRLNMKDVDDLRATLLAIQDGTAKGTGFYPREYRVNKRIQLLAEPRWLQNWSRREDR